MIPASVAMFSTDEILKSAVKELNKHNIETPHLDARVLLSHLLKIPMEKIISGDFSLNDTQSEEYQKLIERRKNREPVSHIIGIREFWGIEFKVTNETLDPRPDSETIIEAALEYFPKTAPLKILDLGTGTGCLILTLLKEFPHSSGFAVDISAPALIVANENSLSLGLSKRCKFISGSWGEGLDEKFDLIVSNPPYIKKSELKKLAPEITAYEPIIALDGGEDGFDCYRHIISEIPEMLEHNGIAIIEIGKGQKPGLIDIINKNNLSLISCRKDLSGIERCVILKKQ